MPPPFHTGLGISLSKKGIVPFDPLSLDPYLLFDTQSSMRGTLEATTLDLDPATPSSLDVITAVRAGVATYTDASGNVATAAADTVRVDQTQGAELTPTKFQNIGYTDFNNATLWAKNDATLTSGQLSPTGDNTATKLTATGSDPWVYAVINTSAQTHTFSFYCKGEGPTIGKTARVLFWYVGGATGATQSVDFTYSGEWQRFEFQTTPTGAGTLAYRIDVPTDSFVVAGESVYIYGPQVEEGTTASSFVANTTGSPKFITGATYGPRVPMMLIEPSATNLLPYSEDFSNAAWIEYEGGTGVAPTVTPDFGTSPDGTVSASRMQFNKGSGTGYTNMSVVYDSVATSSGATTSKSVYLKSNTTEAYEMVLYEVTDASGSNVKKITVTPDWQRFDVYGAIAATTTGIVIGLREINVTGLSNTADILVWGAQVETGSVATSYIPTSGGNAAARTRAADDLVIRDKTNLVPYSEDFSQWTPESATTATTLLSGPISGQNASKLITTAAIQRQGLTLVQTGTGDMVVSVFAKKGEYDVLQITDAVNGASFVNFDLTSGTVGSSNTMVGEIQSFGNGWYRCISKFNSSSSIIRIRLSVAESSTDGRLLHFAGNGTDGLYLWGAQRETGSVATSYIPTSGAAASRNTFSDFYNQSEGTFYIEAVDRQATGSSHAYLAGQSTSQFFMYTNSNGISFASLDGTNILSLGPIVANQLLRAAVSYKTGVSPAPSVKSLSFNGTSVVDQPYSDNFAATNILKIGNGYTDVFSGHFRRILFWPTHSDSL
jgi:hypothetical protein